MAAEFRSQRNYHPGLYRWSILLAFCTLLLVVAGGLVTSRDAGLSVPDWPLSYGQLMPPMEGGILYEHGHRMVATTVGILTIVVDGLALSRRTPQMAALAGRDCSACGDLQGVLGGLTVLTCFPGGFRLPTHVWRNCSFRRQSRWRCLPRTGGCAARCRLKKTRSFRSASLSLAAPVCVLGQLALGAAARHKAIGSIYHISAAPIVTGVILWVALRILLHYAGNRELRLASTTLLAVTFCQVFLGIAAYMSRIASADAVQPMPLMVTFTVLHVAVGALTMAASVALAILVRRNVMEPETALARAHCRQGPSTGRLPRRPDVALPCGTT